MFCPNCAIEINENDMMCANCGELIEVDAFIDYDKNAKLIETFDEEELVDIAMSFDDDDFEEFVPEGDHFSEDKLFKVETSKVKVETEEKNIDIEQFEEIDATFDDVEFFENDEFDKIETSEDISVENDEKSEVAEVIDETDEIDEVNEIDEDIDIEPSKSVTKSDENKDYLKLNFNSMEKIVKNVSQDKIKESEMIDSSESIANIDDFIETISDLEEDIEISSQELLTRIADSATAHQLHIENAEREKKLALENYYKQYRNTILVVIKRSFITIAIIACVIMIYDLVTDNFARMTSQVYQDHMIREYDKATWEIVETIIELDKVLVKGVKDYANRLITAEELEVIVENHIEQINGKNEVFNVYVYEEAEDYLFVASKFAFISQFISENILDYFATRDPNYHVAYTESTEKLDELYILVNQERINFLSKIGFSDEEIEEIVNGN